MLRDDQRLAEWLMDVAGPIVRYRTAIELMGLERGAEREALLGDLLACAEVRRWLDNLGRGPVHHSKDTAAENAMAKLCEYGLGAGIPEFDAKMLPYCACDPGTSSYDDALILTPFLVRAGYEEEPAVSAWLARRLADLVRTAEIGDYDLYMGEHELAKVPKSQRSKKLYKPKFSSAGGFPLPSCYDLYSLCYRSRDDPEIADAIDQVMGYLLDERFQTTPGGYGWNPELRRSHAAGRTFLGMLSGYASYERNAGQMWRFVLWVEAAARNPVLRESDWFRRGLEHLEGFVTERGTYGFPRHYLQERTNGYYLYAGAHMGLGENRRRRVALEIESTFRMLLIQHLIGQETS